MTGGARSRCVATTRDGQPCQADAIQGSQFCLFHDPARAQDQTEARREGGRASRKPTVVLTAPDAGDCPLDTVCHVKTLLGDTIRHVRTGQLDPKVANTVGYLAGILLKAVEVGELESRLATLESAISAQPRKDAVAVFDYPLPGEEEAP